MASHAIAFSAEDLWNLPDDGMRHELVAGQLRTMTPAGAEHGRVSAAAAVLLGVHARTNGVGVTFGAETGFVLASDPDTVRAPDAAFVGQARADAVGRIVKFWPEPPDFAVEVVSPGDISSEVESKAIAWVAAGVIAILVLDPARRTATVYRANGDIRVFTASSPEGEGELDLSDAVPGWRVAVADFFA
jgi:Uma2 family endonuclease